MMCGRVKKQIADDKCYDFTTSRKGGWWAQSLGVGMRGWSLSKDLKERMKAMWIFGKDCPKGRGSRCKGCRRVSRTSETFVSGAQCTQESGRRWRWRGSPGPHQEGWRHDCRTLAFILSNVGRHWRASGREAIHSHYWVEKRHQRGKVGSRETSQGTTAAARQPGWIKT